MKNGLDRRLGFGLLVFYGVGIMVGAGIYVLIGAAAGAAGVYAPLGFLAAGVLALPTAMSYAELSSRIPKSAGEAAYIVAAFRIPILGQAVGLLTVFTGTVAAAAVLQGGAGYLLQLVGFEKTELIVGAGILLTLVALVGVLESLLVAGVSRKSW
jgi:APA family basic amino acid/polyamine antiporter